MKQLFFPTQAEVELMHVKVIEETGGSYGLRDAGALESALKAAENRAYYEDAPLAVLGATYPFTYRRHTLLLTEINESRRSRLSCFLK